MSVSDKINLGGIFHNAFLSILYSELTAHFRAKLVKLIYAHLLVVVEFCGITAAGERCHGYSLIKRKIILSRNGIGKPLGKRRNAEEGGHK